MKNRTTSSLRKGRVNLAGAQYFFTICARRPECRLVSGDCSTAIASSLSRCENDGDLTLIAFTIMPDHLHVLATMSDRLTIGQVIGKFKMQTKVLLESMDVHWQENFYEHRLRPEDITGNYARYIFLNPYRNKLIARCETWPFWSKAKDVDFDFVHLLDAGGLPPEEWLTAEIESLGVQRDFVGVD